MTAIPVLSFIAAACSAERLEPMLSALFSARKKLPDFEVLLLDDASLDGAWEVALAYQARYPDCITLCRAAFPIGRESSFQKALLLHRQSKYILDLEQAFEWGFDPQRIAGEAAARASPGCPPHFAHAPRPESFLPGQRAPEPFFFSMPGSSSPASPLVSVLIYNYNYGRYLDECLSSVFAQTWQNLEVCFSDNASEDDSWAIALKWAERRPGRIHLVRNRVNRGANANRMNCLHHVRGQYLLTLCSDDAMHPEYLERCVGALETHPTAAFAIVHRAIMDEDGRITREPPFYDRSCLIPGASQAAVYMMTPVTPSISQVFYRTQEYLERHLLRNALGADWWNAWIGDFLLCTENDLVYLSEPLLHCRVHAKSDGSSLEGNLMQVVGQYVLAHQLAVAAACHGMPPEVPARLPEASAQCARLGLRYALRFLLKGEENLARRYFCLAEALAPEVASDPVFLLLGKYWRTEGAAQREILSKLRAIPNLERRAVSYEPPPGFQAL
jgi:glycosyltransferase involved in cell wall biosynthesis